MQISNKYGTVEFNWDDNYKNPMLGYSGGADSTLLLWLCLKVMEEKPEDVTLHLFTGIYPSKGDYHEDYAKENLAAMLEEFPALKDRVEMFVFYADEPNDNLNKQLEFMAEGKYDIRIFGLTANPPHDVMERHNLLEDRELSRDIRKGKEPWIVKESEYMVPKYNPFVDVDKRFVAQAYKDLGLMKYYNKTVSCEAFRDDLYRPEFIDSVLPCKECWWCREKFMAFGMYDGEWNEDNK